MNHRNLVMHRRYPVLNHQEMSRSSRSSRTEFVHATVEDDLIGPGHVRSRSRSRTRSSSKPRITTTTPLVGSSGLLVKPGLEIYLPQRGRYIVVEDDYKKKKNYHNHHQPEFVLVNKENGRAIPLHSLYQNPGSSSRIADPPVDYYYDHQRSSGSVISSSSSSIRPGNQNGSAASTSGPTSGSGSLGSGPGSTTNNPSADMSGKPRFIAVTSLEDVQAVRCAEFHPSGRLYAVGSNSKTLRICSYPKLSDLRDDHSTCQSTVLFKRTKHHKGSIYCLAWSPAGDLIATGSNDKTVKLMRFNADTCNIEGQEIELTMHDGTVRDMCFIEDMSNKSSLLVSGGAGDCKIYVTDCATGTPFQALSGHSGHVLSLYTWGGAMFISGSQDKTVRMWDLRTRGCVNMITPLTTPSSPVNKGSPVASVAVDPSGRLLVSGHEDSSCVLFDIRGNRTIQSFKPHSADVRSVRFSPSAYYLLTGGYDNKLILTDLQGDLTMTLPSIVVAQHQDKVISGRWHPNEFSFISSSADKTSALWALPPL